MTGGWTGGASGPEKGEGGESDDLNTIKQQLAELQSKLNKMS